MKVIEVLSGYNSARIEMKKVIGGMQLRRTTATDLQSALEKVLELQKLIPVSMLKQLRMNEIRRHLGRRPTCNELELYRHEEMAFYDKLGIADELSASTVTLHNVMLQEAAKFDLGRMYSGKYH